MESSTWEWARVLYCGRIEPAIIHTKTGGPILFTNQDKWGCPRARLRFDDSML